MLRRTAAAVLLVPAAMALAACQANATVEIAQDNSAAISIDLLDDADMFIPNGMTCDMVENMMAGTGDVSLTWEEYEADGHAGCRIQMSGDAAVDGNVLTDNGDTLTLNLDSSSFGGVSTTDIEVLNSQVNFNLDVIMPGKIIEATNGGTIDGNRATYTSLDVLSEGLKVTGEKGVANSSGMALAAKIGLTLLALALIAALLIFFVVRSRKSKAHPAQPYGIPAAAPMPPQGANAHMPSVPFGGDAPASPAVPPANEAAIGTPAQAPLPSEPPMPEEAPGQRATSILSEPPAPSTVPNATVGETVIPPVGHPDDSGVPQPMFDGDTTAPVVNTAVPPVDVNADVPVAPLPVADTPLVDEDDEPAVIASNEEIVESEADADLTHEDDAAQADHAEEVLARHRAEAEAEAEAAAAEPKIITSNEEIVESEADADLTHEDDAAQADHAEEVLARHRAEAEAEAAPAHMSEAPSEAAIADVPEPDAPSATSDEPVSTFDAARAKAAETGAELMDTLKAKAAEAREKAIQYAEGDGAAKLEELKAKASEAGDGLQSAFEALRSKASEAKKKAEEYLNKDDNPDQ